MSDTFGRRVIYLPCLPLDFFPCSKSPRRWRQTRLCWVTRSVPSRPFFGSVGIANGGGTIIDMSPPCGTSTGLRLVSSWPGAGAGVGIDTQWGFRPSGEIAMDVLGSQYSLLLRYPGRVFVQKRIICSSSTGSGKEGLGGAV